MAPPPHVMTGEGQAPLSLVTHVNESIGTMAGDAFPAAAMMPVDGQQI